MGKESEWESIKVTAQSVYCWILPKEPCEGKNTRESSRLLLNDEPTTIRKQIR